MNLRASRERFVLVRPVEEGRVELASDPPGVVAVIKSSFPMVSPDWSSNSSLSSPLKLEDELKEVPLRV